MLFVASLAACEGYSTAGWRSTLVSNRIPPNTMRPRRSPMTLKVSGVPPAQAQARHTPLRSYAPVLLGASVFLGVTAAGASPASAVDLAQGLAFDGSALVDRTLGPGFAQAFSLIFISELGDKTFFIAALLAAKFGKLVSFTGSVGALVVMTAISVVIGQVSSLHCLTRDCAPNLASRT